MLHFTVLRVTFNITNLVINKVLTLATFDSNCVSTQIFYIPTRNFTFNHFPGNLMLTSFTRHLVRHPFQHFSFHRSAKMSSLTLSSVVDEFNRLAPLSLAEPWDNVGLLVEPSGPKVVRKILLTNDLTHVVMQEAEESSVDLIYSYHPPIFAPMKRISASNWKVIYLLNGISIVQPLNRIFLAQIGSNNRSVLREQNCRLLSPHLIRCSEGWRE